MSRRADAQQRTNNLGIAKVSRPYPTTLLRERLTSSSLLLDEFDQGSETAFRMHEATVVPRLPGRGAGSLALPGGNHCLEAAQSLTRYPMW